MIAGEGACLVCGQPLEYSTHPVEMECFFCHQKVQSYARCSGGHFICDKCHAQLGSNSALSICLRSASKNPVGILQEMMADPHVHMHGPEHHVMVGCALITAAHNAGASFDLRMALLEMNARGGNYPGGACGFWGACGAAVSVGMAISIMTGATPLSGKAWGLANSGTAQALKAIGAIGGPRCCKRNSFTAIREAAPFFAGRLGIRLEMPEKIACAYSPENQQCLRKACPYYQEQPLRNSSAFALKPMNALH